MTDTNETPDTIDMEKHFGEARATAIQQMPYFGALLFGMKFMATKNPAITTMATTKNGICVYNEDFVMRLSTVQFAFVLLHEAQHLFRRHFDRGDAIGINTRAKAQDFNLCADVPINECLAEAFKMRIPNLIYVETFTDSGVPVTRDHFEEEIYKLLLEWREEQPEPECSCQQDQTEEDEGDEGESLGDKPQDGEGPGEGEATESAEEGKGTKSDDADDDESADGEGDNPSDNGSESDGGNGEEEGSGQGPGQSKGQGSGQGSGQGGCEKCKPSGGLDSDIDCGSIAHGNEGAADQIAKDGGVDGMSNADRDWAIRNAAEEIRQHQKTRGNVPGDLVQVAEVELGPRTVNWGREVQARIRSAAAKGRGTRRKFDRRARRNHADAHILPRKAKQTFNIAFLFDTSGSMGGKDINEMLTEIESATRMDGVELTVYECDAGIARKREGNIVAREARSGKATVAGRGGTDMSKGMATVREDGNYDLIVIGTDGCTPWPETPYDEKCLAVITASGEMSAPDWIKMIQVQKAA